MLTILKFCFLALLYLFLWRVVRVVLQELRAPALADGAGRCRRAPGDDRTEARAQGRAPADPRAARARRARSIRSATRSPSGRGGGCGIVLATTFVSTVHARVFRRGGDVFVEDLGSRNGTFVNGERVDDGHTGCGGATACSSGRPSRRSVR